MFANINRKLIIMLLFLFIPASIFCRIKLPKLISDGMVLQREINVRIWGWASAGEKITVHFVDSTYRVTANNNGEWAVMLSKLKAGGPYVMQFNASNSITINDIVVGDVWICSGQSNMQLMLGWLDGTYKDEIDNSENPFIRQFSVPLGTNFNRRETDLKFGKWQQANPKNVSRFTAVGYFFAKYLYEKYKVPIGLINSSFGGSSTEAWISEESIKSFPKYFEVVQRFKDPGYIEKINKQDDERIANWNKLISQNDEGLSRRDGLPKNPKQTWFNPELNTSDWETIQVPGYWTDTKLGLMNGVVWYRKEINITPDMVGKPAVIKLGRIFDCDTVFINGKFVGSVGSQYAPRIYKIPEDLLKEGSNIIVVRDISYIRHGGFVPGKEYEIAAGDKKINLEGEWKYKVGTIAEALEDRLFLAKIPTGLFNSMLAPILNYTIKGVAWYQGESNTSRAFEHYELFKLLIKDWRENWHQGDFPFLFVQLPNFVEVNEETTKYDWAYFRESQLKALSIPNTGMAVTIDIGEYNDIHPKDKKDVGYRLALAAEKVAYGENNIVYSGPIYKSMEIDGSKVILSFNQVGTGLIAKNGNEPASHARSAEARQVGGLMDFKICGIDNEFYPAVAKIVNNTVVVSSNKVKSPVAVRYAWDNNPQGANLYNKEGLPASPFRTDEFKK